MEIIIGFISALIFEVLTLKVLRFFLFYTTVQESTCQVYTLFGKVVEIVDEPGLHFLWPRLTWKAFVINILGRVYVLDLRMDQVYLRSQPVNSEEGAPMGVGIWYEMFISSPMSYLFKNTDPKGSLSANVSNASVRTLSNLPLVKLLSDRHELSQNLREEVTQKSQEWGYKLGSVYIRKVHFRDHNMIREIESKVVNRLRQVTSSIKQDGENQVNIITSSAQRTASVEFAKASAIHPQILGKALQDISQDKDVAEALFATLEFEKMNESAGEIVLLPKSHGMLADLIGAQKTT
ncbi:MAG: SPFH domain-containing protein [Bdellovibrionaceae bacterium]|nr:SPFH domain-containing protein [Pseudobdellovibrionaceae bacterium]